MMARSTERCATRASRRLKRLAALVNEQGEDAEALRAELQAERRIAAGAGNGRPFFPGNALRAKTLAARRDRLLAMRSKGVIGDEAFHRLEEELDFSDVAVATRMQA
jgi:monovalent cation/hydrogen antiporter